jgi:alanyl aminopeptidase
LIGNLAVIVDSGKMPLGEALTLVSGLAKDPAREVVTKTMWISTGLEEKIVPETLLPKYRRYLLDLYGEREYKLGWKAKPDEDDDTRLLRPGILSVVANEAEDMVLVDQAKRLAVQWLDNRQAIDPDMVDVVLYTAARHGDRALFDRFRTEAKKEKDERQRQELLSALGSFRDPNIIDIALPIVLTDEFDIRESLSILFGPTQSSKTRDLAFNFVKENWDALVAKLPTDYGAFLPYVAAGYSDEKHRAEVESFFSGRSTKYTGGPRILAQVLEGINLQGAYKNAHRASVVTFLGQYGNRAS